ncbi:FMN-binding negative transcriptional regulator [Aquabacterium sp. OR-4]|uniref:FMN-binding negative transcriptional regulator n=1 Tax=Aquabacterium sp. OR-4 TaxID=2978127 RepID=UPI0021B257D8|nr:FMN-binding negative transcriptional regulator [Aquabacterium sp. OR-4]MDT7838554.1 FMN-binding negative transcriptional regulator [Aquabacterium sp. OR-4]
MYLPAHFAPSQPEALHQLIRANPLGALVMHGADGLDADHLPFELDAAAGPLGRLSAHVARANPLWQRAAGGADVLVIFRGAQAYVSPSWYPSKHESHRQVPTWNYEVVHAHGRLSVCDDERFVRGLVARLTRAHEAAEPRPWKMGDSAPEFIQELLGKIVGIEITITALTGKSKLSQNKSVPDRQGAADALDQRGQPALAEAMRKTI